MGLLAERRFAGVLAHHGGQVILVLEHHERWGGQFWNVPSGMVEAHETPAEGAARELAEETGLTVLPRHLRLRTTTSVDVDGDLVRAWNFDVHIDEPTVRVQDPDRLVQQASWFPVEEAIARLRRLPYRPLAEPAIATLAGALTGMRHWTYRSPDADPELSLEDWS